MPADNVPGATGGPHDPARIKSEFRRQLGRLLALITAPVLLLAVVVIIQFYGFGNVGGWYILPLLAVSALGGLIGGLLLKCPKCGTRQPFRTAFRSDNQCRKCDAVLF